MLRLHDEAARRANSLSAGRASLRNWHVKKLTGAFPASSLSQLEEYLQYQTCLITQAFIKQLRQAFITLIKHRARTQQANSTSA